MGNIKWIFVLLKIHDSQQLEKTLSLNSNWFINESIPFFVICFDTLHKAGWLSIQNAVSTGSHGKQLLSAEEGKSCEEM